jgi:hypothetical protein
MAVSPELALDEVMDRPVATQNTHIVKYVKYPKHFQIYHEGKSECECKHVDKV